jgi:hypothetical protein
MADDEKLPVLKKEYSKLKTKYDLPSFEEMNQDFHIEKLCELETDYLIREIRKFLSDKLQNYARFIEAIIHPSNASMFIFSLIKTLDEKDKKILTEVYKKLARLEVDIIELDVNFSEIKEAEFVKDFYSVWQDVKKDMSKIMDSVKGNWDKEIEKNTKAYFG